MPARRQAREEETGATVYLLGSSSGILRVHVPLAFRNIFASFRGDVIPAHDSLWMRMRLRYQGVASLRLFLLCSLGDAVWVVSLR